MAKRIPIGNVDKDRSMPIIGWIKRRMGEDKVVATARARQMKWWHPDLEIDCDARWWVWRFPVGYVPRYMGEDHGVDKG